MITRETRETISALDALLEDEREILLAGRLTEIKALYERKTELVEKLRAMDLRDRDQLVAITQKFDRNQALLQSTLSGIRAVADRLAEVRKVRESLETYDAQGKRKSVKTKAEHSLEKRA